MLTEEFQNQLGQENSKLRSLIIKEVRKPGKSEFVCSCLYTLTPRYYSLVFRRGESKLAWFQLHEAITMECYCGALARNTSVYLSYGKNFGGEKLGE